MIRTRSELLAFIASDHPLAVLMSAARARLDADDPGHDLAHALRVGLWTIRLGGAGIDPREAIAAALFHDVVNLPKTSPDRAQASEMSATAARSFLVEGGFDACQIERICEAITDHSYSRGAIPESALGKALQDADRLEAIGAIGLFRTVSTGTRMGARYFDPADPWGERRELDDLRYSVDHFWKKLLKLPSTMQTEAGREEARRRAAFMVRFVEQLASELGAEVPRARIERALATTAGSSPDGSSG